MELFRMTDIIPLLGIQDPPANRGSYKKRRRILELLFIEGLEPIEVSELLGCSLQHVYNRRSAAIKELRSALNEEDKK